VLLIRFTLISAVKNTGASAVQKMLLGTFGFDLIVEKLSG